MADSSSIVALIVAGGRGLRFGQDIPKQYLALAGKPVLAHTLEAFASSRKIDRLIIVIHPDDEKLANGALSEIKNKNKPLLLTYGGETRQESVYNGLQSILSSGGASLVLIHDAARPFVSAELIDHAIRAGQKFKAALPGLPLSDTIKETDTDGFVTHTPDRSVLRAVQTPQSFDFDLILKAHEEARKQQVVNVTDDGALIEWFGEKVFIYEGSTDNIKLTYKEDLDRMEQRMEKAMITRVGNGFDVHAFTAGDHIWLGGLKIPHNQGVLAHSDGDVILHALTDALLGSLAEGDIGTLFPPSDPQWKGASSDIFLKEAVRRVHAKNGIIDHLDITLLCETPKLSPYREKMRLRIAEITGLEMDQVSLKATTTEKLGFTGRQEGIAALATATIRLAR